MKRNGRPRRALLVALCPADILPVIDVGADHGHVAHALGAVATERMPGRTGRTDVPWVIADGLAPFRQVGVAIIAGMGANTIAGILDRGPRPQALVLHAQDDPPLLRRLLKARGWRIDAEGLAPEAGRFAEVIRALPGAESASGMVLEFGPRLLEGHDPLLRAHLSELLGYWRGIANATAGRAADRHAWAAARVAFLARQLG